MKRLISSIISLAVLAQAIPTYAFSGEFFVQIESDIYELSIDLTGGQMGASVATGDFNGDKIDDLVSAAPFANLGGSFWTGAVSIFQGARDGKADAIIFGDAAGDQFGTAIATGDYNGDGFDDLVVGSYNHQFEDGRNGKVDVYYGSPDFFSKSAIYSSRKPDIILSGQGVDRAFGLSIVTLDFNGDGVSDLAVGAPKSDMGAVIVYMGTRDGLMEDYDLYISGSDLDGRFGAAITGGDLNNDGMEDLVVGAYRVDDDEIEDSGAVYIYHGRSDFLHFRDVPNKVINGDTAMGWFGFALDTGDLNGDGVTDLAMTSFPYTDESQKGSVKLIFGNRIFFRDNDKVAVIENMGEGPAIGASVAADDIDTDGKADLIVGAPGTSISESDYGSVYIMNGRSKWAEHISLVDDSLTALIHGESAGSWFGYSLETLDFNNDGYRDVAVGARYSDDYNSVNDGKTFVLLGRSALYEHPKHINSSEGGQVTRGGFVEAVVDKFDLRSVKKDVITQCDQYREFCLFNFMAMSSFSGIAIEPEVLLYPDIPLGSEYYEEIKIATMLGLINGFLNESDSPFHPERPISRIQALKVILAAGELVPNRYKFELVDELGSPEAVQNQFTYFEDVDPRIDQMWWYPRYVNFAVENDIVDRGELFRPDDYITINELTDMIERTLEFKKTDAEADISRNSGN